MPTTIAGKYEVLERIGGGGQGTVYRVRHLFLEEIRALKVQADPGQDAPESAARVLREGRALARLRHPHIVQVFDLGRDGNQHYLEMEYVDGPNLAQWLRTAGRPPLREALAIARQIAGALAYAHTQAHVDSTGTPRAGMTHRDVKPSNILLRRGAETHALLADFGLVKLSDGSDRTQIGSLMGTYRYSAPEQLGLKRNGVRTVVDQRADVFSLGLVLFEMIEGRPFHGALGSEEVMARLLLDREPLAPQFTVPIDPELAALVTAMVHRHPEDRLPGAMAEVVETLDRVIVRIPAAVPDDDRTTFEPDDRTQPLGAVLAAEAARAAAAKSAPPAVPPPAPRPPAERVPPPPPPRAAPRELPPPAGRSGIPRAVWVVAALLVASGAALMLWPNADRPPSRQALRIASADPRESTVRVPVGERQRFTISVMDPKSHPEVDIVWQIDGREVGRGPTFAFAATAADDGATRMLSALATDASGKVSRTWTVTVPTPPTTMRTVSVETLPTVPPATTLETVPPPTTPPATSVPTTSPPATAVPTTLPPAAAAGPQIVARTPASDRVALVQGDSLQFAVRFADGEDTAHYRYAWFQDGRPVGSEPTWRYRSPQTPAARVPVQIELEVTDQAGRAAERVVWRVEMRAAPPRILEVRPVSRELKLAAGEPGELFVRAVPGQPDAVLRYEWRIDKLPARITKTGTLAVPDDLTIGKHTIEVIAVDDQEDRRSASQRFTVIVSASPSTPPPTLAPRRTAPPADVAPAPQGRVTEAEARQWVERLRSAWSRRDRNALRALGELPSGNLPPGRVVIGEPSITLDANGANVWYDRIEDGISTSKRVRLVRDPSGRLIRR